MANTKSTSTSKKTSTAKAKKADQSAANQPSMIAENTVLKLVIPKKAAEAAYQKELQHHASTMKIDGFRKGKVPLHVAEKKLDAGHMIEHAVERILPEFYAELIKKEDKHPLTAPEINIVSANKGEDWTLEINIAEKPTVKLGDYKKLIKKGLKAAEKEIAEREKEQAKASKESKKKSASETTKSGADAKAKLDESTQNGKLTDQQLQELKLQYIFRELATEIKPEIPELLIKQEVRQQMNKLAQQLDNIQMTLDDYLQRRQIKFEDLSQEMAIQALSSFQIDFILQEIKDSEKITPTDEDLTNYLKTVKSDKKVSDLDEETKNYLESTLARRKVIDFLLGA